MLEVDRPLNIPSNQRLLRPTTYYYTRITNILLIEYVSLIHATHYHVLQHTTSVRTTFTRVSTLKD